MKRRILPVALWGALGALLLWIGYLFLIACDVSRPAWFGLQFCPGVAAERAPAELARERERAEFLQRQVEQAEISLAQLPACTTQPCVPRQVSKEQEVVVILDASLSMILPLELTPAELPVVRQVETERDPNRVPDPEAERVFNELLKGNHGRLTRFDGAKRELISLIRPLGDKRLSLVTMRGCNWSDVAQGRASEIEQMVTPIALPPEGKGTDLA